MKEFTVFVRLETRAIAVSGKLHVSTVNDEAWTKYRGLLTEAGFRVSEQWDDVTGHGAVRVTAEEGPS